jgi:hypothetical protein
MDLTNQLELIQKIKETIKSNKYFDIIEKAWLGWLFCQK